MTCLDVMTVCPGDPVFPQVRPRQWETLHTYIHTYGKLPKIVDRSFTPVVGNLCGPAVFPLHHEAASNPIHQFCKAAPVIPLGLRQFFSHIHVQRYVFVSACYFDMKSQDATLGSLNLRMSLRISLLLSKIPICLKLQLNFANLYVLLPARFLLATRQQKFQKAAFIDP